MIYYCSLTICPCCASLTEFPALEWRKRQTFLFFAKNATNTRACFCKLNCVVAGPSWPRVLRRGFAASRLLGLWVRIPPGAWMFVCCECCVLAGRGLCDGLITRTEAGNFWTLLRTYIRTSWKVCNWFKAISVHFQPTNFCSQINDRNEHV
jgi:hypothetical protein